MQSKTPCFSGFFEQKVSVRKYAFSLFGRLQTCKTPISEPKSGIEKRLMRQSVTLLCPDLKVRMHSRRLLALIKSL